MLIAIVEKLTQETEVSTPKAIDDVDPQACFREGYTSDAVRRGLTKQTEPSQPMNTGRGLPIRELLQLPGLRASRVEGKQGLQVDA